MALSGLSATKSFSDGDQGWMQNKTGPLSQERLENFFSLTSPLIGLIEQMSTDG
jgi:hypothetical protein